jgi:hypothetical protein
MVHRYGRVRPTAATAGEVLIAFSRDEEVKAKLGEIYRKLFEGEGVRQGSSPDHFIYVTPGKARGEINEVATWIEARFGPPASTVPARTPFGYLSGRYDGWITYFAALMFGSDRGLAVDFTESVARMSWASYDTSRAGDVGGGPLPPSPPPSPPPSRPSPPPPSPPPSRPSPPATPSGAPGAPSGWGARPSPPATPSGAPRAPSGWGARLVTPYYVRPAARPSAPGAPVSAYATAIDLGEMGERVKRVERPSWVERATAEFIGVKPLPPPAGSRLLGTRRAFVWKKVTPAMKELESPEMRATKELEDWEREMEEEEERYRQEKIQEAKMYFRQRRERMAKPEYIAQQQEAVARVAEEVARVSEDEERQERAAEEARVRAAKRPKRSRETKVTKVRSRKTKVTKVES